MPRRATSLESAPIGLRKASIPDSGPAKGHLPRGSDFGDVVKQRDTGPVPRSIARGTQKSDVVKSEHSKPGGARPNGRGEAIAMPLGKTGPIAITVVARWRRALRAEADGLIARLAQRIDALELAHA